MSVTGKMKCKYRLPCGWCDKLNQECSEDYKPTGYAVEDSGLSINSMPGTSSHAYLCDNVSVTKTISPNDVSLHVPSDNCTHYWDCTGVDTLGADYVCSICGKAKRENFA